MGLLLRVAAIPTKYAGVHLRSRLAPRWAAFFDLAGWRWQYELLDLNGWIPDFQLCGKVPALVEVKPIDFSEFSNMETAFKCIEGTAFKVVMFRDRYRPLRGDCEIAYCLWSYPSQITHAGFSVPILGYMLHANLKPASKIGPRFVPDMNHRTWIISA